MQSSPNPRMHVGKTYGRHHSSSNSLRFCCHAPSERPATNHLHPTFVIPPPAYPCRYPLCPAFSSSAFHLLPTVSSCCYPRRWYLHLPQYHRGLGPTHEVRQEV